MSFKCAYCSNPAIYSCTCANPKVNYCNSHQEYHESLPGIHILYLRKIKHLIPLQKSKKDLIERIIQIKNKTQIQIQDLLQKTSKLILGIKDRVKKIISLSNQFQVHCNSIMSEILSIYEINLKKFYTPLEKIISSTDNHFILSLIQAPIIAFSENIQEITYIPSNFPHFLYNYSDYAISFVSKNEIAAYPSNKIIKDPTYLNWTSRFLNVGNKKLLITGGDQNMGNCFLLDLKREVFMNYPSLIYPRYWHSMSWIDNSPAVIGGEDDDKYLNSVEIFKDSKWIQGLSINISRSSHTSITHHKATWVIGGSSSKTEKLDSIEKYEKNEWKILELKLIITCSMIVIVSL